MGWIKKNLPLVILGVVSAAMIAAAVFYLISRQQASAAQSKAYATAIEDYKKIMSQDPFPSQENIQTAEAESAKLKEVITRIKPLFTVPAEPELEPQEFQATLSTTLDRLRRKAENIGVDLPSRYAFTFAAQQSMTEFPTNSIAPLTQQLRDVEKICDILFDSQVHSLDLLARVRAYPGEAVGGSGYIPNKITVTTDFGVQVTPYEVGFSGFSSQLADVLSGLENSSTYFVVKMVQVSPKTEMESGGGAMGNMAAPMSPPPPGARPATPARAGGVTPEVPAAPAAAAGAPQVLETVLDELPMRFTLNVEVFRLPARAPSTARAMN